MSTDKFSLRARDFLAAASLLLMTCLAAWSADVVRGYYSLVCFPTMDQAVMYATQPSPEKVRREFPCQQGYRLKTLTRGGENCVQCRSGGYKCEGYVAVACVPVPSGTARSVQDLSTRLEAEKPAKSTSQQDGWGKMLEASGFAAHARQVRQSCDDDMFRYWDTNTGVCRLLSRAQDATGRFGTQYNSGGEGVHVFDFPRPETGQVLRISWDFQTVPDRIKVFYGSVTVLDTGMVSGAGSRTLPGFFGDSLRVVTTGGANGTAWSFTLSR